MLYGINLFELTSVSNKPVWNHFNPNSTLKYIVNNDYMYNNLLWLQCYKQTKIAFLDKETELWFQRIAQKLTIFNQHTLLFLCT